ESIHKMRTACPILTNGDIVFLCLSKLKLPDAIIKICMGIVGAYAIKQRRRRIKTKMRTHQCVELLKSLL
ncbi:MAG: hypothetical protein LBO74_16115, partial [Candidatus Symbiothrix sp.]|nr:hypothetical protein [Candidatus Symbiothrix sp.]